MPDDDTLPAAATLIADLADFETPSPASGTPLDDTPEPADDFLASFADVLDPNAPATSEPTPATPEPPSVAPEPPPAAAEDEDGIPASLPGKPSASASAAWDKAKAKKEEYRAKAEQAEKLVRERDTELEKLRKEVASIPDLSERAKLADEAERELAIARVEGTREYKSTILAPLEAIEKAATAIAAANDIKLEAILDVLTETDPAKQSEALDDLVSGLKTVDQLRVVRMAEDTRALLVKRDEIRERATEARKELEEITAKKDVQTRKAARESFERAVDHTIGSLKERVPFVPLTEGETADAMFSAILEKARGSDFDSASQDTKAVAAVATILLPRVTKQLVKMQAEVKKLEARLAEGNKTRPTVASTPAVADAKDEDDFLGGFHDLLGLSRSHPITALLE